MLHCLRSIAGNSSGPPEEFCEIVFIASMMSSLVILLSDSVFPCDKVINSVNDYGKKNILTIYFFSTNHLEIHAICSIINKIYSNKRMSSNNK